MKGGTDRRPLIRNHKQLNGGAVPLLVMYNVTPGPATPAVVFCGEPKRHELEQVVEVLVPCHDHHFDDFAQKFQSKTTNLYYVWQIDNRNCEENCL